MALLSRDGGGLWLLVESVLLAFSAVGIISLMRLLPPFRGLVAAKKKPWSCDICLSFWILLLMCLSLGNWERAVMFAGPPSYGLAIFLLKWLRDPEIPGFDSEGK